MALCRLQFCDCPIWVSAFVDRVNVQLLDNIFHLFLTHTSFIYVLAYTIQHPNIIITTEALLLNNNELTGTLRDGFETFTRLNFTDLSNNQLSGTIPGSFFEIPTLTNLYLNNNSFTGEIPSNYGNASSLRDLFLSSNSLTGTIPDINPGQLGELNEFLLDNTRLEGNMPKSICNLRTSGRLEDLWVDCLGSSPEVACNVPECCTACF